MKKTWSLIKVSLSHDMNIFKINTKKNSKLSKVLFPLLLTIYIMFFLGIYSDKLINMLIPMNLEFVVLTLFGLSVSLITLVEGIYKSGSLLFNCKDDNLLLSLPIKKSTILFIRIFKFYVFELLYNSLFLLPAIIVYALYMVPGWTYYLSSFVALLLLPIIPIILSCILGFIITYLSSKFKGKKIFQTIFTTIFLLIVIYISYNVDSLADKIVENATSINDLITKLYYPVGAYITLVTDFNVITLLIYLLVHIALFATVVYVLSKIYYKLNSNFKRVLTKHKSNNTNYKIKTSSQMKAILKKELNRFVSTPVFIINAGFGLVLFILACVFCSIKFDSLVGTLSNSGSSFNIDTFKTYIPVIMFGVVCFSSLMTSITSSMISLEGKTFNILKSFPIKSINIVMYKVFAALLIMIPCILIGDIIIFIRFKFNIINILLILMASIIFPLVAELIGISVNLRHPKMNATNDTEVVKQSMSSMISTLLGFGLFELTAFLLYMMISSGINTYLTMIIFLAIYGFLCFLLWLHLVKTCDKRFNNIN